MNQFAYGEKKKSIPMVVILSVITCGIYVLYWYYDITKQIAEYNEDYETKPGTVVLLGILTCGIYFIYWWYKISQMFIVSQQKAGMKYIVDNKTLLIVLNMFAPSVAMAIFQLELNRFWDALDAGGGQQVDDDEWFDY